MSAKHRGAQGGAQKPSYPANPLARPSVGRSRPALLASASIIALAAIGVSGAARAACVPSLQTISGPVSGPVVSNGGAINVTGAGDISGGPDGVDALTCAITALTNQQGGAISGGAGGLSAAGGVGVSNAVTITTLANFGKISGGTGGAGSRTGPVGGTTLSNSGAISGCAGGGATGTGARGGAGVSNAGTINLLTNSGAISGGLGVVGHGGSGVSNGGTVTTLINNGAINGGESTSAGAGGAALSNAGTIADTDQQRRDQRRHRPWPWRLRRVQRRDDHHADQQRRDQRRRRLQFWQPPRRNGRGRRGRVKRTGSLDRNVGQSSRRLDQRRGH